MSGRKRRARCMKITTRGLFDLNGWLTSPMGCCCRAEGHVDSRANERTNRPPSAAVARSNRGWHSRYVGFHGSFPRRTHSTPRVMGLRPRPSPTTRGASDLRFRLRRFGPLSQLSGPKPGMGQVPSSGTAGLIVFSSGEMEAANLRIAAHRSEKQSGTSIRRPSGGWLALGFPGSLALGMPPIAWGWAEEMETGAPGGLSTIQHQHGARVGNTNARY